MVTRCIVIFLLLQAGWVQAADPEDSQVTPARSNRIASKAMMKERTLGKQALARLVVAVGYSEASNRPHEWGRTLGGLGKRVGSSFGILAIKNSVQFTVGYLRHEEFGYQASGKVGFKPRLTYALLSTVRTRDTRSHERKWATGRISGIFASSVISRAWQPARLRTVSGGFSSAGIILGVDAGTNVLREFWPEIRHPHRKKDKGATAVAREAAPALLE